MTIDELIAAASDRLTPVERRIAEAILADPTLLAFGTVSDLAQKVGSSRPSIVRFGVKLGFQGYADMREHARRSVSAKLSRPSQRIRQQDSSLGRATAALTEAIRGLLDKIGSEQLSTLGAPMVSANHVWILSGETSRAGAHAMFSGLTMVRPNVHLITEHSSGRDLSGAAPGDAAIVFDFARYRRHTVTAARSAVDLGVHLVAITDGPLSPYAAMTETWCALDIPAIGPFDSSVPSVAIAEMLVAYVARQLQDEARSRIDRTEALWQATEIYWE
ncbi:MAG: MurR/RpiR family transcriptional regulator [Planctomycetes bacterium]|jgi:DNA-binding MurR/RpiR family transcriptional regulator|nr:MurR/RpiR family transcriptional regulator [Planctomycetota bacterium]MBT4029200.1 MurR/RpiR family transcriptional regulator [Planctomycetota bacterium]MBT4559281.1 MurR/RpiR family transcriptional regulator [Planctomycetota bacterium]MBT5101999.1 MurR/RpiR family transcriptional regulator [Planctomycetota bacterium]MBT5120300.1 MurR/RpiR family transcriptional regulator [Planctomycetota bacterium]